MSAMQDKQHNATAELAQDAFVQPVSITLSGTSVVFTLHGPGDVSLGEAS